RARNWRRGVWKPIVNATVGEPFRFHELRHTHAALLISEGQHSKVIQERLGHASIRTTLDVYGHLLEGLDEKAADALDLPKLHRTAHDGAWGSCGVGWKPEVAAWFVVSSDQGFRLWS
ncbi:MAG: tyrosine-type recombinase/integrase, partial [Acidobacteria bacterium]|nr:tyrosine-type recombinase/integrase [Acidobacteriota bacterium]